MITPNNVNQREIRFFILIEKSGVNTGFNVDARHLVEITEESLTVSYWIFKSMSS